jgi:hypothetical protein
MKFPLTLPSPSPLGERDGVRGPEKFFSEIQMDSTELGF